MTETCFCPQLENYSFDEFWLLLRRKLLVFEIAMHAFSNVWGKFSFVLWFFLLQLCVSEDGSEFRFGPEKDIFWHLSFEESAQRNAVIFLRCERNRDLEGSLVSLVGEVLVLAGNGGQLQLVEKFAAPKLVKDIAHNSEGSFLASSLEIEPPRELRHSFRLLLGHNQWVHFQRKVGQLAIDLGKLLQEMVQSLLELQQKFVIRRATLHLFINFSTLVEGGLAHHRVKSNNNKIET